MPVHARHIIQVDAAVNAAASGKPLEIQWPASVLPGPELTIAALHAGKRLVVNYRRESLAKHDTSGIAVHLLSQPALLTPL